MTDVPIWWKQPRRVAVVVDSPSWIEPFALRLVQEIRTGGDNAVFIRDYQAIEPGSVAFFLGCTRIAPLAALQKSKRNLVIHESDLPRGRGFSPLSWQVLEGNDRIPVCLFEAAEAVDAGPVVFRDWIALQGNELLEELRQRLGELTIGLCRRYLLSPLPPVGEAQTGEATFYRRRKPADSQLDVTKSIAEQFDLLRIVDNDRYPAWFEHRGRRYRLRIDELN